MVTIRDWRTSPSKEKPVGSTYGSASAAGFEFKPNISQALPVSQTPDSLGEAKDSADRKYINFIALLAFACRTLLPIQL